MKKRSWGAQRFFLLGLLCGGGILSVTQSWALDYCPGRVCRSYERASQRESMRGSTDHSLPGQFDFYVLALTWSAEFCQRHQSASQQCVGNKNLGFVVHGLWPQYYNGYPLYCRNEATLSTNALKKARDYFPTERLARYEWRKHGVCSGKTPNAYLEDVSRARKLVKIPPLLLDPKTDQTIRLQALYGEFLKINPNLYPGMFSINCRRGVLTEVRVCISQNLRHYQLCPQVLEQSCRSSDIFIPSFH